jgi:hypothetical protein
MPDALRTIRKPQIDAFAAASTAAFYERLADHVKRVFPAHAAMVRGRRGRKFMESCVARAAEYGIREGRSIARFADLVIALGERFDDEPRNEWMREILASKLGDEGKMYLIYKKLPEKCPGPPVAMPPEFAEDEELERNRPPVLVRVNVGLE